MTPRKSRAAAPEGARTQRCQNSSTLCSNSGRSSPPRPSRSLARSPRPSKPPPRTSWPFQAHARAWHRKAAAEPALDCPHRRARVREGHGRDRLEGRRSRHRVHPRATERVPENLGEVAEQARPGRRALHAGAARGVCQRLLAEKELQLAHLDMGSDSYCLVVVPAARAKQLVELTRGAGFGRVVLFTARVSRAPRANAKLASSTNSAGSRPSRERARPRARPDLRQ